MTKREYNKIHQWNLRHWVKTGICEHCLITTKTQWSNKTGKYLLGVASDWQELCPKCHSKYDRANFEHTFNSRPRTRPRDDYGKPLSKKALKKLRQYAWYKDTYYAVLPRATD